MKMSRVEEYLDSLFPNPKCELDYSNTFELICAVMLSAQTTDKAVNLITPNLFNHYPTLESLSNARLEDVENLSAIDGYNFFRTYSRLKSYDKYIILVYEDEIVEDNPKNRYIRFIKENTTYRSCIFRKVGNKSKTKNKNDNKRLKENHQLSR